jgi:hypothetical protein
MRWAREAVHAAFCDGGDHRVPEQFQPATSRSSESAAAASITMR